MAEPSKEPAYIYRILPSTFNVPSPLPQSFTLPKTSLDIDSGFIHFSTSAQVPYVLNRFFSAPEHGKVWLIKIDYARLASDGDVRWEKAGRDGSLFAHLYGQELTGQVVEDLRKVDQGDGWDSVLQKLAEDEWLK
ncbi:MAG: hypothetical protein Q9181_003243 [Wetmoreana brouardii]